MEDCIVLARTLGEPAGVDVSVDVDEALPPLDDERQTLLFRIAQEALTNTVRHAGAAHASIGLAMRGSRLVLTVTDDGRGFDVDAAAMAASAGASAGLGGMRDRVALHGGRLRIEADDRGTRLQADVPVPGSTAGGPDA